ncbi:hypothetical protein [Legionella fallonii]|uniref:Uncharacterized protein n=1 Tax=Legionella fallonii LLAP-10 TaxID=1212491 RepID=A0A098G9X8_9GAMM|nr:hypothetical protein [Legionella fallonii]CEG59284.1 protein of unknown function [Legionella fallonii LLAP-10]
MNEEKRNWSLLDEFWLKFKPLAVQIQPTNRNVREVDQSIDSLKEFITNIVEGDKNQKKIGQE